MLLIGALLTGAGFACERLIARRRDVDLQGPAFALLTGWALLCLAGVVCAVTGAPLTPAAIAIGLVGVVGYAVNRKAARGFAPLAFAWLLLLPLIAIASVIPPTMSDEFPALLPNAKTLVAADIFPDRARPNVWGSKPEYPPALPLIGYVGARLGIDVAYPGKIFTVLLAGAFGLALAELIVGRVGTLAAIAIGVALASVLNPFFDPRIALSAHTDTPTGFVLALGVAASWRALREKSWAMHAAAAAIVLILLRETNLVFVAALAIGLLACRRPKLAAAITLPALAVFGLWRLYIVLAGWVPTMTTKPFVAWDWSAPFLMVRVLFGDRLANNPVLGMAAAGLALAGALLFVRIIRSGDRALRALFVFVGIIGMTYCAFLAWAYAAVFSSEAETANSAWRYLSQLGPLFIYAIVAAIARALPPRVAIAGSRTIAVGAALCLVPLLLPLATSAHWRIDCRYPDVAVVRHAIHAIAKHVGSEKIAVVHPSEANLYIEIVDYELGRPVRSTLGYKSAEEVPPAGYLLDLRQLERHRLTQDGAVPQIELSRWDGSWKPMLTLAPEKPPACGAKTFEKWQFTQRSIAANSP
jgi:hypothetical protein